MLFRLPLAPDFAALDVVTSTAKRRPSRFQFGVIKCFFQRLNFITCLRYGADKTHAAEQERRNSERKTNYQNVAGKSQLTEQDKQCAERQAV